jgi:hypothetical protein
VDWAGDPHNEVAGPVEWSFTEQVQADDAHDAVWESQQRHWFDRPGWMPVPVVIGEVHV